MLNAMVLRQRLARIAAIDIRDEVLAKLMVLEYANLPRFQELNKWQAGEGGYPESLRKLESWALAEEASPGEAPGKDLEEWNKSSLRSWLRMQPALSNTDLRDYFWLARDRTSSTLAGVTMVSPLVRRLFDQLTGDNEGEQNIAARDAAKLEEAERDALLQLLQQQVERHPDQLAGPAALTRLAEHKLEGAARTLFASLRNANPDLLEPGVAFRVKALGQSDPAMRDGSDEVLQYFRTKTNTKVGRAAENALKQ